MDQRKVWLNMLDGIVVFFSLDEAEGLTIDAGSSDNCSAGDLCERDLNNCLVGRVRSSGSCWDFFHVDPAHCALMC